MPSDRVAVDQEARGGASLRWFDRACVGLVVLGIAAALGPALLGRGALVDLNLLTNYAPWSTAGRAVSLACRSDTVDYLSGLATVRDGVLAGQLVTWTPYEVGGAPLGSLPNHAAFSPISLPYYLMPMWLAPAYVKLLEILVVVLGMVLFLGRLHVRRSSAAVAGLLFAYTGFLVMWTNWPHTKVACFIPLLFWAVERLIQVGSASAAAPLALVVAAMLLGGFPAVTMFALTLAGVYALARVVSRRHAQPAGTRSGLTSLGHALGGVVLGCGLTAFQLLPFVANLGTMGAERDARGAHLPASLFLTTVAPEAFGLCVDTRFGPASPIEGTVYLGAACLALAAAAVLLGRNGRGRGDRAPAAFFAAAAVVIAVLVFVGGPLLTALQLLPFYSSNGIARASSVLGFVVAVLAGIGLDRCSRRLSRCAATPLRLPEGGRRGSAGPGRRGRGSRSARLAPAVLVGSSAAVVYGASVWAASAVVDTPVERAQVLRTGAFGIALLVVAAVLVVLAIHVRQPILRSVSLVLVVLLAVGQGVSFARAAWPLSDPDNYYPETGTHRFLQEEIGGERYAGGEATMLPSTADAYRLRTPTGHEFTDPRWLDLLEAADPDVRLTATYSSFSRSTTIAEMAASPILDRLAVRYWTARSTTAPGTTSALPGSVRGTPYRLDEQGATCSIPGGPLRGVRIRLPGRRAFPPGREVELTATVRAAQGDLDGTARLSRARRVRVVDVPIAGGADLPGTGTLPVELRVEGLRAPLQVVARDGSPWCAAVRPPDDGATLVHSDAGATVYERESALPRIRWAGSAEVVTEPEERLAQLSSGVDPGTVLLEDADLAGGSGQDATVRTVTDAAEEIAVEVAAEGDGYLVVADSVARPGWEARLDGKVVPLEPADHAFGAVAVPAGEHTVSLRYVAPGLRAGALVSAGSTVLVLVLAVVPGARRRRRAGASSGGDEG